MYRNFHRIKTDIARLKPLISYNIKGKYIGFYVKLWKCNLVYYYYASYYLVKLCISIGKIIKSTKLAESVVKT